MMITFNCDWTLPEEEAPQNTRNSSSAAGDLRGVSAIIGTDWRPVCPANDNLPVWLVVYG